MGHFELGGWYPSAPPACVTTRSSSCRRCSRVFRASSMARSNRATARSGSPPTRSLSQRRGGQRLEAPAEIGLLGGALVRLREAFGSPQTGLVRALRRHEQGGARLSLSISAPLPSPPAPPCRRRWRRPPNRPRLRERPLRRLRWQEETSGARAVERARRPAAAAHAAAAAAGCSSRSLRAASRTVSAAIRHAQMLCPADDEQK